MRTQAERLTAAVIGRGSGVMADRRGNQPMGLGEVEGGGNFSRPLLVCGGAVRLLLSGALWWRKESSILEM